MEVSGQLHAPAALPPRKKPLVPIGQGAELRPEPVWTGWWRRGKFSPTAGNLTSDHPAPSPALVVSLSLVMCVNDRFVSEVNKMKSQRTGFET